jgi:tetratricopeptide (TPR) repeat protein
MKSNRGVFKISIAYLAILAATFLVMPLYVNALSSKDKFLIAESCYSKLKKDSSRQKYRDQWMICISKYQDVFRSDPNDPWAAAGLYMSGVLYHELFTMSGLSSDQREATDTFQRIIKRYPSSKYRQKAKDHLNKIIMADKNDPYSKKATHQAPKDLSLDHTEFQEFEPVPDIAVRPDISLESDKAIIAHKKSLKFQTRKELSSDLKRPPVSESLTDLILMSETEKNQNPIEIFADKYHLRYRASLLVKPELYPIGY